MMLKVRFLNPTFIWILLNEDNTNMMSTIIAEVYVLFTHVIYGYLVGTYFTKV